MNQGGAVTTAKFQRRPNVKIKLTMITVSTSSCQIAAPFLYYGFERLWEKAAHKKETGQPRREMGFEGRNNLAIMSARTKNSVDGGDFLSSPYTNANLAPMRVLKLHFSTEEIVLLRCEKRDFSFHLSVKCAFVLM